MKHHPLFAITLISSLLLTSCSEATEPLPVLDDIDKIEEEQTLNFDPDTQYVMFSLNVHDWVNPEESAATINKVIDLHETYEIPVGIYITDPTFQNYMDMEDPLLDRLVESDYVELGYHFRPPYPAYSGFDHPSISKMNEEEQYETLLEYETHALDLVTGEPTDEEGGLQYIIDTLGEVPIIAGLGSSMGPTRETLAQIYTEMGVIFTVGRNGKDIGDMEYDFFIRPEHYDLKLYEKVHAYNKNNTAIEEIINDAVAGLVEAKEGPAVLGIKYHENNFYLTGTPFAPCMWEGGDKSKPLEPPYDLELCYEGESIRNKMAQNEHWKLYEATLEYLDENRESYTMIGLEDVLEMME